MAWPSGDPLDPFVPSVAALAGVMAPFAIRRSRRTRTARAFRWLGLLLVCGAVLQGCHGNSSGGMTSPGGGTQAGTYTVTVTATSGSTSHTAPYALTVT
jgi:hypothetical protein